MAFMRGQVVQIGNFSQTGLRRSSRLRLSAVAFSCSIIGRRFVFPLHKHLAEKLGSRITTLYLAPDTAAPSRPPSNLTDSTPSVSSHSVTRSMAHART